MDFTQNTGHYINTINQMTYYANDQTITKSQQVNNDVFWGLFWVLGSIVLTIVFLWIGEKFGKQT